MIHANGKKIYGTAKGISKKRIEEIKEMCGEYNEIILRNDLNCKGLLEEYL